MASRGSNGRLAWFVDRCLAAKKLSHFRGSGAKFLRIVFKASDQLFKNKN